MSDDPRCCGTGTCIINDEGLCWCGQRWDGEKMGFGAASQKSRTLPDAPHDPKHEAQGRTVQGDGALS